MWLYPKVVAHRGAGTLAPENTLAALRCAQAHGFQAVEFDVMLAHDEVPVLMHDPEFGRTVPGVGKVSDFCARELAMMDAGSWHSPEFAGEPVPQLAQAIDFCRQHRIWMNIEIKPVPGFEVPTGYSTALLARHSYVGNPDPELLPPLLSSFSVEALMAAKVAAPELARGLLVEQVPADWLAQLQALDATSLHVDHRHLTPELVQSVKQAGFALLCYTVNEPTRAAELLEWGVDAICTDRIDLMAPDFQSS
jgi:glycerophosphoryl diester phosphodiesterase